MCVLTHRPDWPSMGFEPLRIFFKQYPFAMFAFRCICLFIFIFFASRECGKTRFECSEKNVGCSTLKWPYCIKYRAIERHISLICMPWADGHCGIYLLAHKSNSKSLDLLCIKRHSKWDSLLQIPIIYQPLILQLIFHLDGPFLQQDFLTAKMRWLR